MEVPSRIRWIDIAKGITIILMIFRHMPNINPYLRGMIISFDMPLFMIINGFLIRDYHVKRTFQRSVKSLLVPYAIICLIQALILMMTAPGIEQAGEAFFGGLDDMIVGMSKHSTKFLSYGSVWLVWFLNCLFLARNLYVLILSLTDKRFVLVRYLILMVVSAAGYLIGTYYAFLPSSLDVAMYSVIFIAAGDILRRERLLEKTEAKYYMLPLIVWVCFLAVRRHIELGTREYPFVYGGAVSAIAGGICVLHLSRLVDRKMTRTAAILNWYGKHSILLLGIHCIEMRFISWERIFSYKALAGTGPLQAFVRFLLISICALLLSAAYKRYQDREEAFRKDAGLQEEKKRMDWPDAAKGICMIAVIAGHMQTDFINQLVYLWHLPVFFLISGYFLKPLPDIAMVKKKAKKLLIPYFNTCAAICILSALRAPLEGKLPSDALKTWIPASLYAAGDALSRTFDIRGIGAIWFLWALFFAYLIVNHFSGKSYGAAAVVLIAAGGWASYKYTGIWLPLSLQSGMLSSVYLLAGHEYRNRGYELSSLKTPWIMGIVLTAALGIQNFKGFWLVQNYLGNGWIDIPVSICASIVVMLFAEQVCRNSGSWKRLFRFFGENSLIILCLHVIELDVFSIQRIFQIINQRIPVPLNEVHLILLVFGARLTYVAAGTVIVKKVISYRKLPAL